MSLLGNGAMVFWHDVSEGDADYKDWHSNQHLEERVGIPGFLRGRRAAAIEGSPAYVIFYEVASVEVLTSGPYLERLGDPTTWTRAVLDRYRNSNRTLGRTERSVGLGVGSVLLTIQLAPTPGQREALHQWLAHDLLEHLTAEASIVGAHFLIADEAASRTETGEKKLRDRPDDVADWILLVEGYECARLQSLARDVLSASALARQGAAPGSRAGLYRLEHVVSADDVEAARKR